MTSNPHQASFDRAIAEFKEGLRRRDVDDFRTTTLDDLKGKIAYLQARQHSQRRLQDFNRLQPFLEAIDQYAKVVALFCSNDEIVALVLGSVKNLLQETSVSDIAFSELLNAYESLGESLPLLLEYQNVFRDKPHMVQILVFLYEDILKFQHIILRYFRQPQWQLLLSESWETCKARLSSIILNVAQRRSLIESQASPRQIEENRASIQQSWQIQDNETHQQDLQRIRDVNNWLRPTNAEDNQVTFVQARADYPGTGQWLLDNTLFKEWFDPRFPTIPPLLWLNSMPGAGKTILASLVVEKAQKLSPAPTVLFFYFKHEDPERNNFVALGRSLLAQFLKHDNELLPSLYQKSCRSGEAVLSSPALVEELLNLAFGNCKSAYIILDGLDECPREQRKCITQWFRKLVEELPNNAPERLRCLFVSQDDGPARKDFVGLPSIKIRAEDNQHDIDEYSRVEADKLLEHHPFLTAEKASGISKTVASSAGGQFLLAKLRWTNLSGHTSIARLEEELDPNVFPKEINDAYRRIIVRINEQAPQAAKEDIFRLLSWLVCAKRSLKWHEIQVMNSINLDEGHVAFERQRFIKSPKDLLASLVETRPDGTLELVHMTAKYFLLETELVKPSREELRLANLCIDYLNLPAFVNPPTAEGVLNGDYGFMNYAVLYWLRHLELGLTLETDEEGEEEQIDHLAESLDNFITHHWTSPTTELTLAKRHSDKLQPLKDRSFYDKLEQAVASTKKQLKNFGNMKEGGIVLNLAGIVRDVRRDLETLVTEELEPTIHELIEERYGSNIFQCPRFSCQFFTAGFSSASERDKHISKHERPFQCSEEKCWRYAFGFASEAERERHMRENHLASTAHDEEFPTDQDVQRSIMTNSMAMDPSPAVNPANHNENTEEASAATVVQEESESESETEQHNRSRQKRPRQTEFKCPHCPRVFKKRYNLQSHLLTHVVDQSHVCRHCNKEFARAGDYKRHLSTHTGEKKFVCYGLLRNGNSWGCGRSFARADTLNKHYESRIGQSCIQAWQQEQEQGQGQ